jgi:hypothetical protein
MKKDMKKIQLEKSFQTRDLPLVAFLTLKNVHFVDKVHQDGIVYFLFPNDEKLDSIIMDFHSGKGIVEPIAFWETLRRIRRLIKAFQEVNN